MAIGGRNGVNISRDGEMRMDTPMMTGAIVLGMLAALILLRRGFRPVIPGISS